MKKYQVLVPYVVFSVKEGKKTNEYSLKKGDIAELPEENITVRALVDRKQVKEVKQTEEKTI